jgi:predicted transcriptional regulator of viral defense system
MKFEKFLDIYQNNPIIDSSSFPIHSDNPAILRRQVRGWVKKGYLISLKRGLYIFGKNFRKNSPSKLLIANYLISPSYLSLEYALEFYGLIPEKVTVLTSITTKKTNLFKNDLGIFEYHSLAKNLFFGFRREKDKGQEVFVAFAEKALLDYFYLNASFVGQIEEFDSLRLQNLESLDNRRLILYSEKYNQRVKQVAKKLSEYKVKNKDKYKKLQ